jgi:cytochrome b involved in lipid metabolism
MQSFTRDQVRLQALDAVEEGTQEILVIFRDMVLSVGKFAKHHPGGLLALKHLNGIPRSNK